MPGCEPRLSPFREQPAESWPLRELRRTPRRATFCAQAAGGATLFVKAFLPRRRIERWRLSRQARQEWENLQQLDRAGIPVPKPLALASARDGRLWIFQEWVDGVPWSLATDPHSLPSVRALAALLRSLHDGGLRDGDRHGGNFLLGPGQRSWAVDFHKARIGKPLRAAERVEALALLHSSLIGSMPARWRLRLLREYWGRRKGFRDFALAVESKAWQRRATSLRRKSRQCWRSGRRFEPMDWEGHRGYRRSDATAIRIQGALRAWKGGNAPAIKRGRRSAVHASAQSLPVAIKIYAHGKLASRLRSSAGWGRARRAWQSAFHLDLCGGLGARALACLEGKSSDLLVSEMLEGLSLSQALTANHGKAEGACQAVGRFVAGVHSGGLRARDLREENLVLTQSAQGWNARLIDFDGLRSTRDPARAVGDWGRLFASLPESMTGPRASMLRAYARQLYGIAHPPTVERLAQVAANAERAVRLRWEKQGKS